MPCDAPGYTAVVRPVAPAPPILPGGGQRDIHVLIGRRHAVLRVVKTAVGGGGGQAEAAGEELHDPVLPGKDAFNLYTLVPRRRLAAAQAVRRDLLQCRLVGGHKPLNPRRMIPAPNCHQQQGRNEERAQENQEHRCFFRFHENNPPGMPGAEATPGRTAEAAAGPPE